MSTFFAQFVSSSVLVGMMSSLLLAWWVFYKGISRSSFTASQRIFAVSMIGIVLFVWFFVALVLARQGFFVEVLSETLPIPNIVFTFVPLAIGVGFLVFLKEDK